MIPAALLLLLLLTGCGKQWEYKPVTNPFELEGRRVGVGIACDTDYALTGRKDLTLVRYNEVSNILLALQYDKIDLMALDELLWKFTATSHGGLKAVTPAFASSGYIAYFHESLRPMRDEFNEFLARYQKTDEYADFLMRFEAFDGKSYVGKDIPLTGTGKTLRVAIDAEGFPRSFAEADEEIPTGYDLEALKLFANENGYKLEFTISSYDDMIYGLQGGLYDVAVGALSDRIDAAALSSYLLATDPLYESPLYFIEKTQQDIEIIDPSTPEQKSPADDTQH